MQPGEIIELKIFVQATIQFIAVLVSVQIDMLIFHAAPETLNENIVNGPAFSIHADVDLIIFQ